MKVAGASRWTWIAAAAVLGCAKKSASTVVEDAPGATSSAPSAPPHRPSLFTFCDYAFHEAKLRDACVVVIRSPNVDYHPDTALACVDALEGAARDGGVYPGTMGLLAACDGVLTGRLGEGARCAFDEECADAMICDHPAFSDSPLVCHRRRANDRCSLRVLGSQLTAPAFAPRPDCAGGQSCRCDAGVCGCGP